MDVQLINNIVDSLKSSSTDSILSTCEFLETVVIFDFPAHVLFHQKDLFTVSTTRRNSQIFLNYFHRIHSNGNDGIIIAVSAETVQ